MSDIPVPGPDGTRKVPADRLTKRQRQTVSLWWNRVPKVLGGQDRHALSEFAGEVIDGVELPTDPDLVEDLGFRGELNIDHFYTEAE